MRPCVNIFASAFLIGAFCQLPALATAESEELDRAMDTNGFISSSILQPAQDAVNRGQKERAMALFKRAIGLWQLEKFEYDDSKDLRTKEIAAIYQSEALMFASLNLRAEEGAAYERLGEQQSSFDKARAADSLMHAANAFQGGQIVR